MFENVEKKVYLVTGGLGHIGSYIVQHIVASRTNCKVIVLDNYYNGSKENLADARIIAPAKWNEIIIENCNIEKQYSVQKIFEKYRPQFVYHQASMLTEDTTKNRILGVQVNINGFQHILEGCLKYEAHKLVFASSASVYGDPDYFPTDETHHFDNCSLLYGNTKIANEALANAYADTEGLKFIGLRYFNVYGERQSTKNLYTQIVPKWINAFIDGKNIEIYGDGSQTMDMIYGADVGRMNVVAMESDYYRGCTGWEYFDGYINIGTGIETSVMSLFHIIKDILEEKGINTNKSTIIYNDHDPALVKKRCADNQLMLKILGSPMVDVKSGISNTIRKILEKKNGNTL